MKYFHKLTLLILIIFGSGQIVRAQDVSSYTGLTLEDYKNIKLPPLSELFENAKSGPIYQKAQAELEVEKKLLSKEKKAFLNFFSIRGSYQYGMYGNDLSFTDVRTPVTYEYTTTAQNSYTIGAAISVPLDALFDLGSRVKRQKLAVKASEFDRELKFEERKKQIIEQYSMANSQIVVLRHSAENYLMANLQYEIAEKDFSAGLIDTSMLSTEKQRQSVALEAFEKSMFELTKSLLLLELLSNTTILTQ